MPALLTTCDLCGRRRNVTKFEMDWRFDGAGNVVDSMRFCKGGCREPKGDVPWSTAFILAGLILATAVALVFVIRAGGR